MTDTTSLREIAAKWLVWAASARSRDQADAFDSGEAHGLTLAASALEKFLAGKGPVPIVAWLVEGDTMREVVHADDLYARTQSGTWPDEHVKWTPLGACSELQTAQPAARAEPQAGEWDGLTPEWRLPCDVKLPPATTIRAGCKLSTLLHALQLRTQPMPEISEEDAAKLREVFNLAAPSPASRARPEAQGEKCPHCGAPCRKEVLMRGGDNGWGDDESRTVYRFSPPADRAPGEVGEDANCECSGTWCDYVQAEYKHPRPVLLTESPVARYVKIGVMCDKCGAIRPAPPTVDEAMVRRASLAYEVAMDGEVYGPEAPEAAMRSALDAALTHQEPAR